MKKLLVFLFAFVMPIFCLGFASALSITASVPSQYQNVQPGSSVYVQTSVQWPENTERVDLTVRYSVEDDRGNEIAYLQALHAIETQASFLDSVVIPQGTKSGLYKVYENISATGNFSQTVASSFTVGNSSQGTFQVYIFLMLGVVLLIAFLVLIELFAVLKKRKGK